MVFLVVIVSSVLAAGPWLLGQISKARWENSDKSDLTFTIVRHITCNVLLSWEIFSVLSSHRSAGKRKEAGSWKATQVLQRISAAGQDSQATVHVLEGRTPLGMAHERPPDLPDLYT
ncbi:hypothetical protein BJV74DRAFT_515184 [Russula compacta]|nr:hypothetical protein BJV74DRAFT_515184 [Russula compacta]